MIQSLTGFVNLTGNAEDDPTASGLATSDIFTGVHLVQGILAALISRTKTSKGAKVEVSLLESTLDIQFELLTTYLNDGNQLPKRAKKGSAHAYVGAPYGIYQTKDSYIAIALTPLDELVKAMGLSLPNQFLAKETWFTERNAIMDFLSEHLIKQATQYWLDLFEPLDFRVSGVFDYKTILNHDAYKVLKMDQEVETSDGITMKTTRCPIRIDGERIFSRKSAPKVGEDNGLIDNEFNLN